MRDKKIKLLLISSLLSASVLSTVATANAAEANVNFRYIDIANLSEKTISEGLIYSVPNEVINEDKSFTLVYKKVNSESIKSEETTQVVSNNTNSTGKSQ